MRTKPRARSVVPVVLKSHGGPVVVERPDFLDQSIVKIAFPLPAQERDNGGPAL